MKRPRHALGIAGFIALGLAMACGSGSSGNDKAPATSKTGPGYLDASTTAPGDSGEASGDDAAVGSTPDASGVAPVDAGPIVAPQPVSPNIVVDQFGYLPVSEKIAVLEEPSSRVRQGHDLYAGRDLCARRRPLQREAPRGGADGVERRRNGLVVW